MKPHALEQPLNRPESNFDQATRSRRSVAGFVARFILILAVLYGLAALPVFRDWAFPAWLRFNANLAAAALNAFGEQTLVNDVTIVSSRVAISIRRGCDAMDPLFLYVAAVLAFAASLRSKAAAIGIGVPAFIALNQVRIVSLYYIGALWPAAFEAAHVEVWQTLFILLVMLVWLLWAWRASAERQAGA